MISLTPELEKKILNSGGVIYYVTLEEFQQLILEGHSLSNEQVKEQFGKIK